MFGLGTPELLIVLVLVMLLFGANKVPQLMKGLGDGMKEFKKATKDEDEPRIVTTTTPVRTEPVRSEVVTTEQPIVTHTEPRV